MEENVREKIYAISEERMEETPLAFKRRLYGEIDWDARLLCLKGPRGVGKTTMLLQRMKESLGPEKALYISLDNVWVDAREVYGLAEYHLGRGGTHLFLDEVHKMEDWQNLVKSLNDDLRRLSVVYSGSSLLKLEKRGGDLSRRQTPFFLPGLSFREYLAFEGLAVPEPVPLERLLADHAAISRSVRSKIPVLKYFEDYRQHGYYPFYKSARGGYLERLHSVVEQTLERDYPEIEDVSLATIKKAEKMLMILAQSCPQVPNMKKLYAELETDRNQGLKILYALQRAGFLSLVSSKAADLGNMSRPDKIYCDNPNLMYALASTVDVGTLRETFFVNQLKAAGHEVQYPPAGDFKVDGKWLFEIGGKGKTFKQIADIKDSFVVNDGIETGFGNKIPLWLFGFLY